MVFPSLYLGRFEIIISNYAIISKKSKYTLLTFIIGLQPTVADLSAITSKTYLRNSKITYV